MPHDPWDLDNNLATIARQWDALIALCGDEAVFRAAAPTVSAWGVDKQVHHVGIVMTGMARAMEGMLANPQQGVGLGPTHPMAMPMLESGAIPRGMGKAPAPLLVEAAPAVSDTRGLLTSAKVKWESISVKRDQIRASRATYQHFALGHFTPLQWTRFMAVHTAHHLKIVRDILEATENTAPFGNDVEMAG